MYLYVRETKVKEKKKHSFWRILLDFILVFCTGGLWLIWLLIRYLRNNG